MEAVKTYDELLTELSNLRQQLEEASETIEAIRSGQIDALVVKGKKGHELYTLKTADQTYRVFIEKMTEGAVTLNHEGIILYSNSQFASLLNIPLSKVIGLPFETFVSKEYKDNFNDLFIRGWKEDCKGELVLIGHEKVVPFQLAFTTLELDEGISLSVILTDLTRQKETQQQLKWNNEQLEEINRALELSNNDLQQFASVASHDLQEPLRKIQIYSNILKTKHSDEFSDKAEQYLEKIISSSDRMSTLITDILNYSRLSSNVIHFEVTDLKKIATELLDDFEIMIDDKKAVVTINDLPHIEVNPGQIRQVFQNLLSNALKFSRTNEQPTIRIEAKTPEAVNHDTNDNGYCYISFKDNGIGFDEKYINNIFTLFQRLNTKDKYEGTGIGLSITKKIVEKHNGYITVKSTEGEGSEFILALPVSQAKV